MNIVGGGDGLRGSENCSLKSGSRQREKAPMATRDVSSKKRDNEEEGAVAAQRILSDSTFASR